LGVYNQLSVRIQECQHVFSMCLDAVACTGVFPPSCIVCHWWSAFEVRMFLCVWFCDFYECICVNWDLTEHQNITGWNLSSDAYTGLFKIIFWVLTTCHTQYTWDRSIWLHQWIKKFSKFSLRCAVCSSYAFLRLERSLLRWRWTAVRRLHADILQTVWNELDFHVDVCRITKGAHIEHL